MRLIKTGILPSSTSPWAFEPRGALLTRLELGGEPAFLINTHLGLSFRERKAQIDCLLGPDWIDSIPEKGGRRTILCGDFNALPDSLVYKTAAGRLRDVQRALPARKARATFSSHYPILRVDHILVSGDWKVERVEVPHTTLTRAASDHLPLIADLSLPV